MFRYPVFLECRTLSRAQEIEVENYFNVSTKSRGGECGPLTKVQDDVYRISFKYQEDQVSVLQRSRHVVQKVPGGPLELKVRESLERPDLRDGTATGPPAEAVPASPSPSSGEGGVHQVYPGSSPMEDPNVEEKVEEIPARWTPTLPEKEEEDPPRTRTGGGSVHVEVVEGTIESQQVDALVSPMRWHDPLSTRVGNDLHRKVGPQLMKRFKEESGYELGEPVLLENLPRLQSAVFFLSLSPWDGDSAGVPVEVLKMGINLILESCDRRGFRSVAFPVLGAGIALSFPNAEVAKVLLEEVHAFALRRSSSAPLLVRVVVHPNDQESSEQFRSVQEDIRQGDQDQESLTKRIVLLGKTGSGKSSLANTIFGEQVFTTNHSPESGTSTSESQTRCIDGSDITLVDTPGLFDTGRSEEDLRHKIISCITECAPGPHAFLILLKVQKFCEQEQAVIQRICEYFSEDALKYAVIVFTHGNQLPTGMKIEEFVSESTKLSELVRRCGGRCHVFDNQYWDNAQQDNYRSNRFQRRELLRTIDRLVVENRGAYYTNRALQEVEQEIQIEEEHIRRTSANLSKQEIRQRAKGNVAHRLLIQLSGIMAGTLLGALFGLEVMVTKVIPVMLEHRPQVTNVMRVAPVRAHSEAMIAAGEVVLPAAAAVAVVGAAMGGIQGGMIGNEAAENADSVWDAVEKAADAVTKKRQTL